MTIVAQSKELLGTVIEIKLLEEDASFFSSCFSELERIEQKYSRFLDSSLLSKLNNNLNVWQDIDDETLYLIEQALELNYLTRGAFDITLKKTLERLGYDQEYSFTPKQDRDNEKEEDNAIQLNVSDKKVLLKKEIEFGGLGKGYALDQVAKLLDNKGVMHYYINAGGDIYAKRGEGEDVWTILLEHPDDPKKTIGTVELNGQAIASSAPNRRRWKGMHHLINAQTKKPEQSVKSVFVLAKKSVEADAMATGLFTAGFEKGMKLAQTLEVESLLISQNNKMFTTDGFQIRFFE